MEKPHLKNPILFFIFALLLTSTVSAVSFPTSYDVFNYGGDRTFLFVVTNDSIRNYDYTTRTENWRINQTIAYNDQVFPTPLYDGYFYASGTLLYEPDGTSSSISSIGSDASENYPYYYAPARHVLGSGDSQIARQTTLSLSQISSNPFSAVSSQYFHDKWNDVVYEWRNSNPTNTIIKYDSDYNILSSQAVNVGGDDVFHAYAGEENRATTDPDVNRYYVGVGLAGGSGDPDNIIASRYYGSFRQVNVVDDTLSNVYNITLPAGHTGYSMTVWNDYGNNLVVVGTEDITYGTNNHTAFLYIYDDDDGSFIGGYSQGYSALSGVNAYLDVEVLPSGDLAIAQYHELTDDEIDFYPLDFGPVKSMDLNTNLPVDDGLLTTGAQYNDLLSTFDYDAHRVYEYTLTPTSFDSIPVDVYRHSEDLTDVDTGVTFDSYVLSDKTVEVTLSDLSLDNFEVPFIVLDPHPDSDIEYSALNYDPVELGNWSVSNLNGGDNRTVTYPIGNNSLAYDYLEFYWNINFSNTTSNPDNAIAWIDFRTTDTTLSGSTWNNESTFSIGVGYPFDGITTGLDNNDSVAVYYRSAATVSESTQLNELIRERSTGGEVESVTLYGYLDRNSLSPRISFRLEVERSGASDTVTLSEWLYSVPIWTNSVTITSSDRLLVDTIETLYCTNGQSYVFASTVSSVSDVMTEFCYEQSNAGVTVRTLQPEFGSLYLNGSNTQIDSEWRVYAYDQPIFGNGDDSVRVSGGEELTARIYNGGESTLRVYSTHLDSENNPNNYEEWTYTVNLDNSVIVGVVDNNPFTSGTSTTGGSVGTSGTGISSTTGDSTYELPNLWVFTQAQSGFIYTLIVLVLIWIVVLGYTLYLANLSGDTWVTSLGAIVASIASLLWIFTAVFIGWLPVWVIVLMILIAGGGVVMVFRRVFMGGE